MVISPLYTLLLLQIFYCKWCFYHYHLYFLIISLNNFLIIFYINFPFYRNKIFYTYQVILFFLVLLPYHSLIELEIFVFYICTPNILYPLSELPNNILITPFFQI